MHLFEHSISTKGTEQMSKVTDMVRGDIKKSGVEQGIVVVYSPHTTAGFTINVEGNSHAHIKTSFVGPSQTLILHNGDLLLGIWQDLYFCEFDGPRNRKFYVKIMEG